MSAAAIAERIRGIELIPDPWPYATLDDFLPADVFEGLLTALPVLKWKSGDPKPQNRNKCARLPGAVTQLLSGGPVMQAVRERFGFSGGKVQLEVAFFGGAGLAAHVDRKDKLWNGQVYLAGDPKGTELFDAKGHLAKVVEWRPNRMTCWPPPGDGLKHAAPKSAGRYVLLWWILADR